MKKLVTLVVFVLATALVAKAQNGLLANTFNSVSAGGAINLLNTAIVNHKITWNVVGTVNTCTVALDSSADGVNWSAGGVVTGQTCTSNGNSATVNLNVNYVRMNVTAFSGTGSVVVTWTGNTALAGAGGLPAGPTSPNGVTFTYCTTPSGGVAGAATTCWPGITVTLQTGATYALAAADRSTCIEINNAAMTVTMPDLGGTNFAFGYNGCIQNLGSAATINRNTTSTFTVIGDQSVAAGATTWTLFANQTAYFYTDTNNNYIVTVAGTTGTNNLSIFNGNASMVSPIPNVALANAGWKQAFLSNTYGMAAGGNQMYWLLGAGGNGWFSISGTPTPANNAGSGSPDTSAGFSFYNSVFSMMGKEHAGCGFTNLATEAFICASSTPHEFMAATNGSSSLGMLNRTQPGQVSLTGQVATIANGTQLCAAAAGACNTAGQYEVTAYFDTTTAGTGNIGFNLTFTDEAGTKTAQTVPLDVAGATSLTGTMLLTAGNNATATTSFWSTGANAIGYGVPYTSTGTYSVRIVVVRKQ